MKENKGLAFTLEDIEFSIELAHKKYQQAVKEQVSVSNLRMLKKDLQFLEKTRMKIFREDIMQIQSLMGEVGELLEK